MKQFRFLKHILPELFIIVAFIGLINLNEFKSDKVIKADAIGYYDYLPALFIHHDLQRKDATLANHPEKYQRIQNEGVYVHYNDRMMDKYPVGTAVLQSPFFIIAYLSTPLSGDLNDGYQKPFQQAVLFSTLFYLFLGLIFLRKILEQYQIRKWIIIFIQILAVFSTNITNYANFDAGFSHVYSFFAINAFLYFTLRYFDKKSFHYFLFASFFLGLVLIIRQINVLILFFTPFLAGSFKNLKQTIQHTFHKPKMLALGVLSVILVFSIQSIAWYVQTGSFLLYSYQGEGFHFSDPQILNILFSYKKGLFVYTPVLIFSLAGLVWLFYKKKFYQAITWFFFFLIITYVFSSWYSWDYAASYGLRVYIDYYAIFFLLIAIFINEINTGFKAIILLLSFLTIPLNLIQTYQYKNYILHWLNMDKQKYWEVFLKTDNRYKGLLWKKDFNPQQYSVLKKLSLGNFDIPKSKVIHTVYQTSSNKIPDFKEVSTIRILLTNNFSSDNNSKVIVRIADSADHKLRYWFDPYLIHFNQHGLNRDQQGAFNYEFKTLSDEQAKIISVSVFSPKQKNQLKNVQIEFLKKIVKPTPALQQQ